jgi:hypothetical protein
MINRFSKSKMEESIYLAWEQELVAQSFVEEQVGTTALKLKPTLE